MGKTPDDIAGEIERLRSESDALVDELLRRASLSHITHGVTSTVTERASSVVSAVGDAASRVNEAAASMPEPVRQHPFVATYATVGLMTTLMGFAVSSIAAGRHRTAPEKAADQLRGSLDHVGSDAQNMLQQLLGLKEVRVAVDKKEDTSMMKRLLWVGLASIMATAGSMLFKQVTAALWRTTMREEPPKS